MQSWSPFVVVRMTFILSKQRACVDKNRKENSSPKWHAQFIRINTEMCQEELGVKLTALIVSAYVVKSNVFLNSEV